MNTSCASSHIRLFFVWCAACLGAAPAVFAKDAIPLKVCAVIADKMEGSAQSGTLQKVWGTPGRTAIGNELTDQLTKHLSERFPHWDFDPHPARVYATLRLRVIEFSGEPNKVYFQLEQFLGENANSAREIWRLTWLEPGDIQASGVPALPNAATIMAASLRRIDDQKEEQLIRNWLQRSVPIGAGGQWLAQNATAGGLRLAVRLPETRFEPLAVSRMQVMCKTGGASALKLAMIGTGDSEEISFAPNPPMRALVLGPADSPAWSTAPPPQTLQSGQIGMIFLEEEIPPFNAQFFSDGSTP